MKAVVMAGGEGSRLRPLTANQPKPLLPVANRPIMEHVLRLLRRHGFDETVVTVQFLASLVRSYFGDGDDLGMHLTYATEATPLGTAGSVLNARAALRDDAFLVMSGDALTDVDLGELVASHRRTGALVTVCLARVPNPLEFGIVIQGEDGRIERLLEKPTWGQVFSDTVNTGIYVMEPEVFDHVAADRAVDWASEVFPALLELGAPVYGHVADGYWDYVKVEGGAQLRPLTILGDNVVVKSGAVLERAVVHSNAFIGSQVGLRGCVIGKSSDVMRVETGVDLRPDRDGDRCPWPRGRPAADHPLHHARERRDRGSRPAHHAGRPAVAGHRLPRRPGADLGPQRQRGLERLLSRQEFRRAFPGEIAELTFPSRTVETYAQEMLRTIDTSGIADAGMRVVLDTVGGAVSLVLPTLLGRLDVDVLTVDNRLSETAGAEARSDQACNLRRLGELVSSSRAAFGVRFDSAGDRLALVDETGCPILDERALLVMLDLVAAEGRGGRVALPVTTTRVAEQVTAFHGTQVLWVSTASDDLARAAARPRVLAVARRRCILRPAPRSGGTHPAHALPDRRSHPEGLPRDPVGPHALGGQGRGHAHGPPGGGPYEVDTTDGVRVVEGSAHWALVLPDPAEAMTHLWAEAPREEQALALLARWVGVVESARA